MSDLIGFHYQRMDADHAVDDLFGKVDGIARAVAPANAGRPRMPSGASGRAADCGRS